MFLDRDGIKNNVTCLSGCEILRSNRGAQVSGHYTLCSGSSGWCMLHVALLTERVLSWPLDFWKMIAPQRSEVDSFTARLCYRLTNFFVTV